MYNAKIVAFDSYVPEQIVTNDDLSNIVDTNDEWIYARTGIRERRLSTGQNTSDLCIEAGKNILAKTNTLPEDIDIIIVATISPDYTTPSTACLVQAGLGTKNAFCFDLAAACSGFVYALSVAEKFIKCGTYKKVLVFGAEVLSKITDWYDRGTCILFADGAGCALVERSEANGFLGEDIRSNGDNALSLTGGDIYVENFVYKSETFDKGYLKMDGRAILNFATRMVPINIKDLLEKTNTDIEDVKYFVLHQANYRIVEAVAKKLGMPMDKFYTNIDKFANTSAASIPIALTEMSDKGLLVKGDKIVLSGFGGGLTWGSLLIEI